MVLRLAVSDMHCRRCGFDARYALARDPYGPGRADKFLMVSGVAATRVLRSGFEWNTNGARQISCK